MIVNKIWTIWSGCSGRSANLLTGMVTMAFVQVIVLVSQRALQVVTAKQCFQPSKAVEECSQKHNWEYAWYVGDYDFGYGPFQSTKSMCQHRWHVKAIKCVRDQMSRPCGENVHSSKLAWTMWSIIFDPAPYKKAADYLCAEQNLNIFLQNQDKCLSKQRVAAMQCKEEQSLLTEVLANTKSTSPPVLTYGADVDSGFSKSQYNDHMKSLLLYYRCHRMQKKLRCLFNLLYKECPSNVVILVMNYFKELMSDDSNCSFQQIATDHERRLKLFQEQQLLQQRVTESPPKFSRDSGYSQGAANAAQIGGKQSPNNSIRQSLPLFHVIITTFWIHMGLCFIIRRICLF